MFGEGFGVVVGYGMDGEPLDKFGNVVEVSPPSPRGRVLHVENCRCPDCSAARARRDEQHKSALLFAAGKTRDRAANCVWPMDCHCSTCTSEAYKPKIDLQPQNMIQLQPQNTHLPRSLDVGAGPFKALAFRRSKRDPTMQRCAFCGDDIIGNRAMTHLQAGQCMLGQVCATEKCTQGVIRVLMEALPYQSIVLVDKDGVEVRLPK